MRTAQDERQLEATSVSCLINCSSVGFEAPDHYAYVQCALDDADTSLSLQRQKAMDLISSTRQVCSCACAFAWMRLCGGRHSYVAPCAVWRCRDALPGSR